MYRSTTKKIQVTVRPEYMEDRSTPEAGEYFWAYTIEIANLGDEPVQLLRRHWRITDGNGYLDEVTGDGVVGEQPTLQPGDAFSYTSGVPLSTPTGIMGGVYQMVSQQGQQFEVEIPIFSLDSPHMNLSVN